MGLLSGNTNSGTSSFMTTGNTLGSFLGNILQSLAGGRTTYARSNRSQRDVERRILTDIENNEGDEEVEGRIINKGEMQAIEDRKPFNFVKFPYHEEEGLRNGKLYDPSAEYNEEDTLKFSQDNRHTNKSGTKMIFPDRHLQFDNDRDSKVRLGTILNSNNYHFNYDNYSKRRPYSSQRDYDYKPLSHQQPPARTTSKPSDFEGNIYVTNSKGVVEYYINKQGRKVYVPFD